jgi:hypothetical protein
MQAHRLPASHGIFWLVAGFKLFRTNPPLLTALTLSYLFLIIAVNMLPIVGPFLVPLALPALLVVLGNGCRAVERGGGTGAIALTYGIPQHRVALVRLGGLHLLGSMVIVAASIVMEGGRIPLPGTGQTVDEEEMLAAMARLLVVALPVVTAFWFAPLLTAWDSISPVKSVFFSFVASWRNWQAFVAYGFAIAMVAIGVPGLLLIGANAISKTLLDVLSVVLKMMLLFVMAPTMMASVYVSYQDVFHAANDTE